MSSARILIWLTLMAISPALQAAPADLTRQVAQCTGRMSAEMEFEWLIGQSGDQSRLMRGHLEDVLEAIAEPDERKFILHLRIEAKHAHAMLLTRSHFNDDARDAERAARMAAQYSESCRAMLMG